MDYSLKIKKKNQKLKETRDTKYIYRNELDKTCFQRDMAYEDFKDLVRIKASNKVFNKAFNVAKNVKYDRCQGGLASMVYKFFYKNPLHLQINPLKVVLLLLYKMRN